MPRPSSAFLTMCSLALSAALVLAVPGAAAPPRKFAVGDKVFVRLHEQFVRIDEPDVHLQRARRSFVKQHSMNAADELEKAAAGFSYLAERAAGDDRRQLELGSRGLGKLADDVRAKKVQEVTELDRALADAERILAREPVKQPGAAPVTPPKTQ